MKIGGEEGPIHECGHSGSGRRVLLILGDSLLTAHCSLLDTFPFENFTR
jgi:hypothetical protein